MEEEKLLRKRKFSAAVSSPDVRKRIPKPASYDSTCLRYNKKKQNAEKRTAKLEQIWAQMQSAAQLSLQHRQIYYSIPSQGYTSEWAYLPPNPTIVKLVPSILTWIREEVVSDVNFRAGRNIRGHLQAGFIAFGAPFAYNNEEFSKSEIPPILRPLQYFAQHVTGVDFNVAYLKVYLKDETGLAWHQDVDAKPMNVACFTLASSVDQLRVLAIATSKCDLKRCELKRPESGSMWYFNGDINKLLYHRVLSLRDEKDARERGVHIPLAGSSSSRPPSSSCPCRPSSASACTSPSESCTSASISSMYSSASPDSSCCSSSCSSSSSACFSGLSSAASSSSVCPASEGEEDDEHEESSEGEECPAPASSELRVTITFRRVVWTMRCE